MYYRLVAAVLVATVGSAAIAQFGPPINDAYQSRVSLQAGQLFSSVEQMRLMLYRDLRIPQAQPLIRAVDAHYEAVLQFVRMLRTNPGRDRIYREYQAIDQSGNLVRNECQQLIRILPNAQLVQLAARVEYNDKLLESAIMSGGAPPVPPGPGPGGITPPPPIPGAMGYGPRVVRLCRTLDTQADALLRISRGPLARSLPLKQDFEQTLAEFTRVTEELKRKADTNAPKQALIVDYTNVLLPRWNAVLKFFAPGSLLGESSEVRTQATYVNDLMTQLGNIIDAQMSGQMPAPPVPGPQPPVPGVRPPFIPGINVRDQKLFAIGAGEGGGPHVRVFQSPRAGDFYDLMAYDPDFRGGVRVALGDVDGDGIRDVITAPGPGGGPVVRVFSGRDYSLITEFNAFDPNYTGGLYVAAADINNNGRAEIVVGTGEVGLPVVRVFEGRTGRQIAETTVYEPGFRGGIRVAIGDVNGDRVPDIICAPGPGRVATIRTLDGRNINNVLNSFDAYDPSFRGGAFVAAADMTGDGKANIVTGAGEGGGPHVKIWDFGRGMIGDFYPYDRRFNGGVRVACRDVNGDGVPDVICAPGQGSVPLIKIFDGRTRNIFSEFMAFDAYFQGGAFVGCR